MHHVYRISQNHAALHSTVSVPGVQSWTESSFLSPDYSNTRIVGSLLSGSKPQHRDVHSSGTATRIQPNSSSMSSLIHFWNAATCWFGTSTTLRVVQPMKATEFHILSTFANSLKTASCKTVAHWWKTHCSREEQRRNSFIV